MNEFFWSVNILAIRQLSVNPIQTLCKQIHPEDMLNGIFFIPTVCTGVPLKELLRIS